MSFIDDVDEMREKAPAGKLPRAMLAGVCIVAAFVLVTAVSGLFVHGGSFVVEQGAEQGAELDGGEAQAGGVAVGEEPSGAGGTLGGESPPGGETSLDTGDQAHLGSLATDGGESADGRESSSFVYVVGEVKKPGVYEVPVDARVNDAVQKAGGLTEQADERAVNLARTVVDGEQIVIPAVGEQVEAAQDGADGASVASPGAREAARAVGSGGGAGTSGGGITADGLVNINLATEEELQTLSGVGEVTARKIVESREAEGPFESPGDIKRVSGIGDKKYEAIASSITV